MGLLSKLEVSRRIVRAAKPRRKQDSVEYRRGKLIANLEEQIELAELAIADRPLQLERKRGHRVVPVRPRIWWRRTPDDRLYTEIRYNKVPLNIEGRGTAIAVPKLRDLPKIYRLVIRAVKAGELDAAIETAVRRSRR